MDRGPRGNSCDCRLVFSILENQSDDGVNIPYCYIHLVVEVQRRVKLMMNYDLGWRDLLRLIPKTVLARLQSVVFIFVVRYLLDNIHFLLLLRLDHRRPLSRLYLFDLRHLIISVLIEGCRGDRIWELIHFLLSVHTLFKLFQAHLVLIYLEVSIIVHELLLELLLQVLLVDEVRHLLLK